MSVDIGVAMDYKADGECEVDHFEACSGPIVILEIIVDGMTYYGSTCQVGYTILNSQYDTVKVIVV